MRVLKSDSGYVLEGDWDGQDAVNAFLNHLAGRGFSAATVRAYAFDVANLSRFLVQQAVGLAAVDAPLVFDWIDWQGVRRTDQPTGGHRSSTPAGSFDGEPPGRGSARVIRVSGDDRCLHRQSGAVAAGGQGLRQSQRGLLGHLGPGRARSGGRLVRQPQRLPESLSTNDVDAFLATLATHRDRAMVLVMLLGGLRSAEARGLLLADVDMGRRRLRVIGKGGKERHVPVDAAFFTELAAYLRWERPPGLATPQCFVVLRGPTTGAPVSEAGLRSLFRRHRETSGATRVRPHRLRHTYGTELSAAGIDLLALRALMGHVSPETTARYVHLSIEQLAAEYGAARATLAGARQ
ncbi:tyrosine-type recombinase/integrase [Mycobacterium avium]|uniref:tyrosine-type recombinase/integrase n=1 Tax=Mycobacterium avium TaxID=1764 RepID=UPI0020C7EE74|nr:tyrosine-type recombinase/integrase [Mycobacterium avium]